MYLSLVESDLLREEHEPPDIFGYEFYFEIYQELSTTRAGGFGLVPISWASIKDYCEFFGLDFSMIESVIRAIDNRFLEYLNGKEGNKT